MLRNRTHNFSANETLKHRREDQIFAFATKEAVDRISDKRYPGMAICATNTVSTLISKMSLSSNSVPVQFCFSVSDSVLKSPERTQKLTRSKPELSQN